MKYIITALLFLAIASWGQQQERVAIIQTVDDRDSISFSDLSFLTDRLRETAANILPKARYGVMTTESIIAFLGSEERAAKICNESSCLAELGRKVNADYVAQARLGRFGKDLSLKTELYSTKSGNLIGSFTGFSKDVYGLLSIIDEKASDLFKKMPGVVAPVAEEDDYEEEDDVKEEKEDKEDKEDKNSLISSDWTEEKINRPFGIRVGINLSHIYQEYEMNLTSLNESGSVIYDNTFGMQLGFVMDFEAVDWFHFQPGLMYIQKGGFNITNHYIELLPLVSFKLSAIRLNVGPYFDWCIHSENDAGNDFGLNGGVGFDIDRFYIGVFYDYGFFNESGDARFSTRTSNRTLGLNLGINLL